MQNVEHIHVCFANWMDDVNCQLARKINDERRSNPRSSYANKFVGIANGQVVVVADDPDELARGLRQTEPDPGKTLAPLRLKRSAGNCYRFPIARKAVITWQYKRQRVLWDTLLAEARKLINTLPSMTRIEAGE